MIPSSRSTCGSIAAIAAALLAVVVSAAPPGAEAQKRRTPARSSARAATKADPVKDLVLAIAVNQRRDGESLFAACERSSFQTLAWTLDAMRTRIALEKGEYETEAEFGVRRRKLEDALNQDRELVVCQPLDDNEDAPFRYDAERQVFAGTFSRHQNVWRDVKRTGSYVSKTRMGVSATVRSSVQIEYDVDLGSALSDRRSDCLKGSYQAEYELAVARENAPLLKARGYLVFTGRLVAPFVDRDDTAGSPTLDDPNDVYERSLTVHFEPSTVSVAGPIGPAAWTCSFRSAG
ncbi:hypothetical protein [Sphingomonas sp. BK069]|uniref:hypothetical protein n=1 Tax=Sphingomonas sp. BK069 TaxID=2586979 RepID=UPI00161DA1ED|nr:hypothetical protein [Sphingomonas sp. BK069]MBB3348341.1 hypothetical protein [Sphingomonas sp. BK069]